MPTSLQQGINAAKAGQTQQALEHLKDAIIEEPQNADVWVWIAAIISDVEKQEIFLKKAIEIDPQNIPAQRGLSYLKKRKQKGEGVNGETLLDHTRPISTFPKSDQVLEQSVENRRVTRLKSDDLVNLPARDNDRIQSDFQAGQISQIPRLTTLEIVLLGVVVVVFAFIGLLASSALFEFDLPWGFLAGNRPRLATDPPYPGVFLYEEDIFFDMEAHEGPPVANVGIPTSSSSRPVAVFWKMDVDPSNINLVHESGTLVVHHSSQSGSSADLIQPISELQDGLYCLKETHQQPPTSTDTYYCFLVNLTAEK